jgi:hypothetical protein
LRAVFVVASEIPESCRVRMDLTGGCADLVYAVEQDDMDVTLWRARFIDGRICSEQGRE